MVPASQIIPQTLSAFVCNRSGPIHFSDSQSDLNTSSKTVYVTTEGAGEKILLALLTFAMMTGTASSQSRQYHDSSGKHIRSATTDSSGTTTLYDSRGRVVTRETTSGNTTTVYYAAGRNVGRFRTGR